MSLFRIPISGWKKCIHEAAAFESRGEYAAASLLDNSVAINWWLRNDPPILRIPSPIGYFEPDFVYLANHGRNQAIGILEIKSDIFWDGESSDARMKANAAGEWVRALNKTEPAPSWEFAVVLDQDAIEASSFEQLRKAALLRVPDKNDDQKA